MKIQFQPRRGSEIVLTEKIESNSVLTTKKKNV